MTGTIARDRFSRRPVLVATLVITVVIIGFVRVQSASADFIRAADVPLGFRAYDVTAADFNHDGKVDLAFPDQEHAVVILSGRGDGTFRPGRSFETGSDPNRIVVGDLNRDGRKDIVTTNLADDGVSVLLARRDGSFRRAVDFGVGDRPSGLAIGRLNGDRWPDLAVTNAFDDDVSVRLGTGRGKLGRRHDYPTGDVPESVAIADFDGDHKRDLAVADLRRPAILRGRGDGTFRRPRSVHSEAPLSLSSIVASRINRDRAMDLLVSSVDSSDEQGVHMFLGYGDGTFQQPKQYPTGAPSKIVVADMTGDGRKDLVTESTGYPDGNGFLYVLRGKRGGTFEVPCHACKPPYFLQPLDGPGGRFAVADLNGDGTRDIATITYVPGAMLEIFLNE